MFTVAERSQIRAGLIAAAKQDARISGGAITGSASVGREDEWSDIDLAFGVKSGCEIRDVLESFTAKMYGEHKALRHLDVFSGPWIYRVFLLANTLQVDIAVVEEKHFGARAPTFNLLFGQAVDLQPGARSQAEEVIGYAWLAALHVRSALARGKFWQAEHYISEMRGRVFSLACLRHDLPEKQARGIDQLPMAIKVQFEEGLVRSLEPDELKRAFRATIGILVSEIGNESSQLGSVLREMGV